MWAGVDYERFAPPRCDRCGGSEFERGGRVGRWDGGCGSGCIYEAVCASCRAVWQSRSDPFACRDAPESPRWFHCEPAEPTAAAETSPKLAVPLSRVESAAADHMLPYPGR
jgi:hypothetical protein